MSEERNKRLNTPVTAKEKEIVVAAAKKRGLSESAYIRQRLIYEGEK